MLLNFKEILFFLAICIASCSEDGIKDKGKFIGHGKYLGGYHKDD